MTRLEQLRLDAGVTPEQLGPMVEVNSGTIRRIESGKGARAATLAKLAKHFGVPASDLRRDALPVVDRRAA